MTLKCLECRTPMPTPPYGKDTECPACHQVYQLAEDWGWWGYTAEVYIPKGAKI